MRLIRLFFVAIQFMTIIPINPGIPVDGRILASSTWAFPLIGLLIGLIDTSVFLALRNIIQPSILAAILIAVPLFITGGIHADGLADTADGIFSGRSRERMLEIMRDSRVGSLGVLTLITYCLLRWSALSEALTLFTVRSVDGTAFWVFIIPPILARISPVVAGYLCKYARQEGGLGQPYTDYVRTPHLIGAASIGLVFFFAGILSTGYVNVALWTAASLLLAGVLTNALIIRKLGGVTGDTLGALLLVTELAGLIASSTVLGRLEL